MQLVLQHHQLHKLQGKLHGVTIASRELPWHRHFETMKRVLHFAVNFTTCLAMIKNTIYSQLVHIAISNCNFLKSLKNHCNPCKNVELNSTSCNLIRIYQFARLNDIRHISCSNLGISVRCLFSLLRNSNLVPATYQQAKIEICPIYVVLVVLIFTF